MSLKVHHGEVKAAGTYRAGVGVRGVGIAACELTAPGVVTLTLVEDIGADEFLALGAQLGAVDGSTVVQRSAANTVIVRSFNTAGVAANRAFSFRFSRIDAGIVPPPVP